jgi:hypothetical protein
MRSLRGLGRAVAVACALLFAAPASASDALEQAQQAELERVRGEVAGEIQLQAYDLVDELVYGWLQDAPFDAPTPVVLAGVTVPVGLGTGLQALLENHIAAVIGENRATNVQLVHCPACTAVVVHSGPEGTVIARGIDDPAVLEELGAGGRHALFIDVEAEGSWLVLRARLTKLTPDLPIVWSHTIASAASSPSLLRQPRDLKSASDARQEYLDVLHDRGPLVIPLRFAVRAYAQPTDGAGVPPPPLIWLQSGAELGTTGGRAWTSSMIVGYAFIPEAYQGLMAQARVSRLLTGRTRSLTRPDLYGFAGAALIHVWGPSALSFQTETLDSDALLRLLTGQDPRASFGAFQVGLDLRVGNRIGLSGFLETIPALGTSPNFGNFVPVAGLKFQSLGTEVTFCF